MVSLTNRVSVKSSHNVHCGKNISSWPSWSSPSHLDYSVVAQADIRGFPRCRTMPTLIPVPQPAYSQARENLMKAIPPKLLCLLACGGIDCRYEGPECWKLNQQVIRGLFSSWWDYVTAVSQMLLCLKNNKWQFANYELTIAGWQMT